MSTFKMGLAAALIAATMAGSASAGESEHSFAHGASKIASVALTPVAGGVGTVLVVAGTPVVVAGRLVADFGVGVKNLVHRQIRSLALLD